MALKNTALTVCYVAWNTSTNAGQTGDSANHTLKLVQDGTEAAATNSPAQVDSTNAPGVYSLVLTSGDMNFNCVVLCGKSSTANVAIIPIVIVTEQGVLARAAPGASGGMITFGTGTGQLNPTSGGVDLQTIKTQALTCSAGVTIEPFVGTATAALIVDASGRVILQPTQTGVTIPTVTTVGTLTTYTGNTPQTGDSFARIGSTGSGLTSLAPSSTALSTANWTNTRAGYLDNLSVGAVAQAATALSTATWTTARAGYLDNLNVGGAVASHADAASLSTQIGTPMQAGSVTVGTNNDKTGYSLASTGLDSITATAPTGVATTFPQMVVQTFLRFFGKSVKAVSGTTIKTYAADGTTVVTTQTFADDGAGNETLGAAS